MRVIEDIIRSEELGYRSLTETECRRLRKHGVKCSPAWAVTVENIASLNSAPRYQGQLWAPTRDRNGHSSTNIIIR